MEQWLQHRHVFLDEFVRLDGLGDAVNGPGTCPSCSNAPAQYRCNDCFGGVLHCSTCTLSSHRDLPLHRLEVCRPSLFLLPTLIVPKTWNGSFFEGATLETLGLILNLCHSSGGICPVNPETQLITVVDLSGHHSIRVRFCKCSASNFLDSFRQLLRVRWYSASTLRPQTAFTFDVLDTYHKVSLQGKLNLYDFYATIMQKTDNCGRSNIKVRFSILCSIEQLKFPYSTSITKWLGVSASGVISRTPSGVRLVTLP